MLLKEIEKALEKTVLDAYRVFKKYPARRPLYVCDCCCPPKTIQKELLENPVQDISFHTLSLYTDHIAGIPKESQDTMMHLLPRYFDFIAQFKYPTGHKHDYFLSFINHIEKQHLSHKEQQIIDDFGKYFFMKYLHYRENEAEIDEILNMLGLAGYNMQKLLNTWGTINNRIAVGHFSELYSNHLDFKNKRFDTFFADDKAFPSEIFDWATSDQTKKIFSEQIEKIILQYNGHISEKDLNALNLTYEILQ